MVTQHYGRLCPLFFNLQIDLFTAMDALFFAVHRGGCRRHRWTHVTRSISQRMIADIFTPIFTPMGAVFFAVHRGGRTCHDWTYVTQ
jgi:hypothetical protein